MSDAIIKVEGLGKRYRIAHARGGYQGLRHVVNDGLANFARRLASWGRKSARAEATPSVEDFWALKDVSFEIKRGEVLGVVGRNGAGKSTLLKILSRITEPTEGRIEIEGRVASLLEVGTGFHPELTGRENIFLNGAVLGMSRAEIRAKFDEIVAFSEVEKFLDTPVKRYSSGMYVRLAFAVAAHLEPEILVVDEVLAVGDAEFQKKCLGKMEAVSRQEGRTILFVSHDLGAVQRLTKTCLLFQKGRLQLQAATDTVVESYLAGFKTAKTTVYDVAGTPRQITGTLFATIEKLWFPNPQSSFEFGEPVRFRAQVRARSELTNVCLSLTIVSVRGVAVGTGYARQLVSLRAGERVELQACLEHEGLAPGQYSCIVGLSRDGWLGEMVLHDVVFDVLYFEVRPPLGKHDIATAWPVAWGGMVFPGLKVGRAGAAPELEVQVADATVEV